MDELQITLTEADLYLLIEALDSHEYWQLSESHERAATRRSRTGRTRRSTPFGS